MTKTKNSMNPDVCRNCLVKVKKHNVRCTFCGEVFIHHIPYFIIFGLTSFLFSAIFLILLVFAFRF